MHAHAHILKENNQLFVYYFINIIVVNRKIVCFRNHQSEGLNTEHNSCIYQSADYTRIYNNDT